jgi:hypothetical protein
VYGNFNEGDNIEWIYEALENQYSFLDDTLYRILGGSYILGPVCYPGWHGFRYYYWVRDTCRETICIEICPSAIVAAYIDETEPIDTVTLTARKDRIRQGLTASSLRDIPGWTHPKSGINTHTGAVPEPSTIALFGFAALQFLMIKRIIRS